jgi:DNA invertase Pin-like site-specific DNA recombinase
VPVLVVGPRLENSGAVDEARRQLIAERTTQAIAERKLAGTYRRRPFVDRSTVEIILGLRRRGWSLRRIAALLNLSGSCS